MCKLSRFLLCSQLLLTLVLGAPSGFDSSLVEQNSECATPLCLWRSQRSSDLGSSDLDLSTTEILSLQTKLAQMDLELNLAQEFLEKDKPHPLLSTPVISEIEGRLQTLYNRHAQLAARFSREYPPLAKLRREIVHTRPNLIRLKQERLDQLRTTLRSEAQSLKEHLAKATQLEKQQEQSSEISSAQGPIGSALRSTTNAIPSTQATRLQRSENRRQQITLDKGPSRPAQTQRGIPTAPLALLLVPLGVLSIWGLIKSTKGKGRLPTSIAQAQKGLRRGLTLSDPSLQPIIGIIPLIDSELDQPHSPQGAAQLNQTWQEVEKLIGSLKPRTRGPGIIVAITGCVRNQGSSTVASNLGAKLAQNSKKVLLLDLDLMQPCLGRLFNLDSKIPGISEVLAGEIDLVQAIRPTNCAGLHILPAGSRITSDLGSITLLRLLEDLTKQYDTIILDCPPRLTPSTLRPLAEVTSSAILVVDANTVSSVEIRSLRLRLRSLGIRVLGTLLNKANQATVQHLADPTRQSSSKPPPHSEAALSIIANIKRRIQVLRLYGFYPQQFTSTIPRIRSTRGTDPVPTICTICPYEEAT